MKTRASSLVVTLMVVVLLTIIAVAFMQTMSLARTTSRSYADMRRAAMAAEAGLGVATAQILLAVGTNSAFVTGSANWPSSDFPVTVIGARDLTNGAQLMPLVSGPTNLLAGFGQPGWEVNFTDYLAARTNTNAAQTVDVNTSEHFIQTTGNTTAYRAPWCVMTNVTGSQTNFTRYAYIVLDEQARLNPLLHTGAGSGMTNAADWYGGPQDISLTNAAAPKLTSGQMAQINGAFAHSPATLGEVFSSRTDYEAVKHLFTPQTDATFDTIPGWLPEGGKLKYNINDLATNTVYGGTAAERATNIAGVIARNLTNFSQRDPALRAVNASAYLNRLAANIVDYIDADAAFTALNGEASGLETSVFPCTFAERVLCTEGGYGQTLDHADIETQWFVNVWNPGTKAVTISSAEIRVWNRYEYSLGGGLAKSPPPYSETVAFPAGKTVRPGEFAVLAFPTRALERVYAPSPTADAPFIKGTENQNFIQYELKINGQIVSRSAGENLGGLEHNQNHPTSDVSRLNPGANSWHVMMLNSWGNQAGDPRFGSFYHTAWVDVITASFYRNKKFWNGRRVETGISATGYQDFTELWKSRDYMPRNPSDGVNPGNLGVTPDTLATGYQAADASAAPGVLRDGPMKSLGELGHIFDPAHAADDLSTANQSTTGKNASGDSLFTSDFQNGGGRTLRIGQPESQGAGTNNWDTASLRAAGLLDLFTVNPTNSGARGRINPNTAPAEVLTALFSSIRLTSDTGMAGGTRAVLNPTNLASGLITNRPYSSLADLYKFLPSLQEATNFSPAIPTYAGTNWAAADRVREEAFGKLVQHFTVQSRTYRIYVIGQVLDKNRRPRSSAVLEACVNLQPGPADGEFQAVIHYAHFLK